LTLDRAWSRPRATKFVYNSNSRKKGKLCNSKENCGIVQKRGKENTLSKHDNDTI